MDPLYIRKLQRPREPSSSHNRPGSEAVTQLTGQKSRAIFDRYNIIHEQELLDAGDQLVAYLAQHVQATLRGWRPHPARPAAPRPTPVLRLV